MSTSSTPRPAEAEAPRKRRERPVGVFMSRFPSVTETFILREMIEMERQGQAVRLVPLLKESPPVIHEAARPWIPRALYTRWLSPAIVASNVRMLLRRPLRYLSLLARLVAGTLRSPEMLLRTLALFPKSVHLAEGLSGERLRHIHAHYATHPATMALIIANLSDMTFSITVHAHDIQIDRSLLGWKLRETRFVRSISEFNKRFLEDLYPEECAGKIVVIHVGIEPGIYENAGARYFPPADRPPRLLCIAAHRPYKGIPVLIEACRILRGQSVAFQCEVVGQGPNTAELEAIVRERQVGDVFRLVGPRPQEELVRMMAESAVIVLPSIIASDGQMEGIPVALMEAMAAGRAVVSTSISGIPELIEDGVNGILVPPEDPVALAAALKSILDDSERARAMGRRGQQKVRAEFTLPHCVSRLLTRLDEENG